MTMRPYCLKCDSAAVAFDDDVLNGARSISCVICGNRQYLGEVNARFGFREATGTDTSFPSSLRTKDSRGSLENCETRTRRECRGQRTAEGSPGNRAQRMNGDRHLGARKARQPGETGHRKMYLSFMGGQGKGSLAEKMPIMAGSFRDARMASVTSDPPPSPVRVMASMLRQSEIVNLMITKTQDPLSRPGWTSRFMDRIEERSSARRELEVRS